MEFGKLQNVDDVNWALPPDDPKSLDFLKAKASGEPAKFYIGAPAWGAKEWVGLIYPPEAKAADFLACYSKSFKFIRRRLQQPYPAKF